MTHVEHDKNYYITTTVYVLQVLGFLTLLTPIAGVIINYVKKDSVRGTYLASHFIWQIRTFWYGAILWPLIGIITSIILIGYVILAVDVIWLIYRIAKGWVYLYSGKSMYHQDDDQQNRTPPKVINP